ncbi:MAG: phosphate ABC transporter permease PstA [Candidatus Binatia bacterium]
MLVTTTLTTWPHRSDRLQGRGVTILLWLIAIVVGALGLWIVGDICAAGFSHLSLEFLTQPPSNAGRAGGISTVLVGTGAILLVALGGMLVFGLGAAILLAEYESQSQGWTKALGRSIDILSGVPSIVFGLFGLAFFGQFLGWGWSILSGGLTLACMVVPLFVRASEESLRRAALPLRSGAAALGMTRTATLWHLILPTAAPGIAVALVLSMSRALAETAALLFTAGAAVRMPTSWFDSARTLSYHVYLLAIEVPGGQPRAYAAALVLLLLVIILNTGTIVLAQRWQRNRLG